MRVDIVLLAVAAAGTEVLVDIHTTAVGYSRISRWHCAVAAAVAAVPTRDGVQRVFPVVPLNFW